MTVIKLKFEHIDNIKKIFNVSKYMSTELNNCVNIFVDDGISDVHYQSFISTYLSGLKNYHSYGFLNQNNEITSLISFYESDFDASWYWTNIRSIEHNKQQIRDILNQVIKYNEENGRFKFYSLFPKKHIRSYRRLIYNWDTMQRYDYFDEYHVTANHQCKFILPWQILYNRTLIPTDTVVRCTFLKQKYRNNLYNAGRL